MKWIFLSFFLFVVGLGIFLSVRVGVFRPVFIDQKQSPVFYLVYRNHTGPYHKINSLITEVEEELGKDGVKCPMTFGEYLDDPREVEEQRLRSRGGCLFTDPPDFVHHLPQDLDFIKTDPEPIIYAEFFGSPAIGPYKVYNKVAKMAEENRIALKKEVIEVYSTDDTGKFKTQYYFRKVVAQ